MNSPWALVLDKVTYPHVRQLSIPLSSYKYSSKRALLARYGYQGRVIGTEPSGGRQPNCTDSARDALVLHLKRIARVGSAVLTECCRSARRQSQSARSTALRSTWRLAHRSAPRSHERH